MTRDWASEANPADLDAVAQALDDGRLTLHRDAMAAAQTLGVVGASALRAFLSSAPGSDPKALAWCLRRLAAERRPDGPLHATWIQGRAEDDQAKLHAAQRGFSQRGMALYAAALARRLADGAEPGPTAAIRALGVADPDRWMAYFMP